MDGQTSEPSVNCPKCNKVIAMKKLHKHWAHAKDHSTPQTPYPPPGLRPLSRFRSPSPISEHPSTSEGGFGDTTQDFGANLDDGAGGPEPMQELSPGGNQSSTVKFGNNAGISMKGSRINQKGQPTLLGTHYIHPQLEHRAAIKVQQASNVYYPFDSSNQQQLARDLSFPVLLTEQRITQIGVKSKHSYLRGSDVPFNSYKDFIGRMDELLRTQSLWQPRRFSDQTRSYPWSGGVKFYARDALAVLQEILENPGLADKCIWEPERVTNGDGERVYTDLHDSEFWWKTQVDTLLGKQLNVDPSIRSKWWSSLHHHTHCPYLR
jgi:hypothetical protein